MVERFKLPGDWQSWRAAADEIRAVILDEAWDEKLNSLTQRLGGGGLDASLLSLSLRRVIPADHPKMVATTAGVQSRRTDFERRESDMADATAGDHRILTARAASSAMISSESSDCNIIKPFAHRASAGVSVGEKAVLVLKARNK